MELANGQKRMKRIFLLFIILFMEARSQDTTPIATYPFKTDMAYQTKLKEFINTYEAQPALSLLDTLAQFSFRHKDWETSISFAQKAIAQKPNAQRYFLLGGAAGFRALEVSIFSSMKYINIMKPAFEESIRLEPENILYLRAQVDVLVALPSLLGGSIENAQNIIDKMIKLDPLEGLLAQGSLYENDTNLKRAKEVYQQVLNYLNQTLGSCNEDFIMYLQKSRRDLAYDLGRITADFDLNISWGNCCLSYFEHTYVLSDTVPKAWVYYQWLRLAKKSKNKQQMKSLISKTIPLENKFPKLEALIEEINL